MTAIALQEEDIYAAQVSGLLSRQGLITDEEELTRYLRGW